MKFTIHQLKQENNTYGKPTWKFFTAHQNGLFVVSQVAQWNKGWQNNMNIDVPDAQVEEKKSKTGNTYFILKAPKFEGESKFGKYSTSMEILSCLRGTIDLVCHDKIPVDQMNSTIAGLFQEIQKIKKSIASTHSQQNPNNNQQDIYKSPNTQPSAYSVNPNNEEIRIEDIPFV